MKKTENNTGKGLKSKESKSEKDFSEEKEMIKENGKGIPKGQSPEANHKKNDVRLSREEESLHRSKPGSTRKFLISVLVIAGLLVIAGIGFVSGVHYQEMIYSGDSSVASDKTWDMYFQEGKSFQQDEDYAEALASYQQIGASFASYDKVKENMDICAAYYSIDILNQAQILVRNGQTEDALEVLCESLQVLGDNDDIKNAIKKIGTAMDKKKVELDLPEGKENYQKQ